ncbi:MAG: hypothetical protein ACPGQL_03055 [Thermoplasmatota archaeon]
MKGRILATCMALFIVGLAPATHASAPVEVRECPAPLGSYGIGVYWNGNQMACVPLDVYVRQCAGHPSAGYELVVFGRGMGCIH